MTILVMMILCHCQMNIKKSGGEHMIKEEDFIWEETAPSSQEQNEEPFDN